MGTVSLIVGEGRGNGVLNVGRDVGTGSLMWGGTGNGVLNVGRDGGTGSLMWGGTGERGP